jgi:hypothetical protein
MSRVKNPVASNLGDHLADFLHNIKTPQKLLEFAIPVIASSFLLDSHPPDMYYKLIIICKYLLNLFVVFNPLDVFRTLYKEICHQVCRTGVLTYEGSIHLILPSGFIRLLEYEFVKQVEAFAKRSNTVATTWH